MKRRIKVYITIGCTLLAVGLGILLYIPLSNEYNAGRMEDTAREYDEKVSRLYEDTDTEEYADDMERTVAQALANADADTNADTDTGTDTDSDIESDADTQAETDTDELDLARLAELRADMELYNRDLLVNGQLLLNDPFAYEEASFDLTEYGIDDGIFGYIEIPEIDLTLPIYLGANKANMKKGAAHLSYSSMPIGGESTNTVLAAHRGIIGKIYFDNIVYLEEGDDVYITNFWETLHYRVVDIEVISPYDIDKCYIQEGRDLVTLLTCHPYGYTTYRYKVVCERAEE